MGVNTRSFAFHTPEGETVERVSKIDSIHKRLHELQEDVKDCVEKMRNRAIAVHDKATDISTPQFCVGDSFVVFKAERHQHEFRVIWSRPQKAITATNPTVCFVENILAQKARNSTRNAFEIIMWYDSRNPCSR